MSVPDKYIQSLLSSGGMAYGPDWLKNYINQSRGFINRVAPEIPKTAKSTLDNILKTSGGNTAVNNLINQANNRLGISPLDLDLNIKGPNILDKTKFRLEPLLDQTKSKLRGVTKFLDKPINIGGEMQRYGIKKNVEGAANFLKDKVGSLQSGINFTPGSILRPTLGFANRALVAEGVKRTTGIEGAYFSPKEVMWGAKTATANPTVGGGLLLGGLIDSFNPIGPKDQFAANRDYTLRNINDINKALDKLPKDNLTKGQLEERIQLRNKLANNKETLAEYEETIRKRDLYNQEQQNQNVSLNDSFYQGPQASQETTEFTQLAPAPVLNRVTGDPGPRIPSSFTPPSFGINTGLVNPAPVVVESAVTSTVPSEDAAQSLVEQAKAKWISDTANSPAQKSGAFNPDDLWKQHLKHQQWRKDQGRNFTHGEYL